MPFSLQPCGYRVAKMQKMASGTGSRRGPARVGRRSRAQAAPGQVGPSLMKLIPAQAFTCLRQRTKLAGVGVAFWVLGARALRDSEHGDGAVVLALHARRSILRRVFGPTDSARQVLCDRMGVWWIGAVFAGERWSLAFFLPTSGSRSKLLRAR